MQVNNYPVRYSESLQLYKSSAPYPMTFMQAPAFDRQILVNFGGQSALQGLSTIRGPFMFPVRTEIIYPRTQIMYPRTHSIPDHFQRTFINLAGGYPSDPQIRRGYYTRSGY